MEVCILICGGNVQQVFCDKQDVIVSILDVDNMIADEIDSKLIDQKVEEVKQRLHTVY